MAILVLAVAACGNPIDVPAQPRDEARSCWLPERFVGDAESPGFFENEVACARAPDSGVPHRFASVTFADLLGWEAVDCPEPDVPCPTE